MKLIALCTIVTGKPGDDYLVAPGDEFEVADEEAERLIAAGNAKAPEAKAKAEPEAKAVKGAKP